MRRYYISLLVVSLILVLTTFIIMWAAPHLFIIAMPLLVLYFAALTMVQHNIVVKAMNRSLTIFLLTNPGQGRRFLIAFCIGYVVYLVYETVALVRFVDRAKKGKN